MSLEKLRVFLGWASVVAWLASLTLAAVDRTYHPDPSVHVVLMVVAGALFGPSIVRRRNGGVKGGDDE